MNHLLARNPLLIIAVLAFSALSGGCAREAAPPRTATVEHPDRSTSAALGVTSRQAEARTTVTREARATMDLSADRDDASEGMTKDDADLAWRARHVLLGDSLLESCPAIDVSASKGKVRMRGTVPSALGHLSAAADVAAVPGVFEIDDQLETQAPQAETRPTATSGSLR
jgi:osmotically-inducible protein OsmY